MTRKRRYRFSKRGMPFSRDVPDISLKGFFAIFFVAALFYACSMSFSGETEKPEKVPNEVDKWLAENCAKGAPYEHYPLCTAGETVPDTEAHKPD